MRHCRFIVFALLLTALTSNGAPAAHGVALLVVNREYKGVDEAKQEDLRPLANALETRGFAVTIKENLGRREIRPTLEEFVRSAPTHGVALVCLSGYVMHGDGGGKGDHYLLPVDVEPRHGREIAHKNLGVSGLLDLMQEESGAAFPLIVLDGSPAHPNRSGDIPATLTPPNDPVPKGSLLCYAGAEFAPALAKKIRDRKTDLVSAIRSTATAANGWSSPPQTTSVPSIRARSGPPTQVCAGKRSGDEWVNVLGSVFCWCPPGSFTMGSPGREDDESPVVVSFEEGFWLGKYEVTMREFNLVTRKNPRNAIASLPNHPRDGIHFDDIRQYVRELNRRERFYKRLPEGWEYALPSEAEWEYACRAGTKSAYSFGDDSAGLTAHANFADRRLFETGDEFYQYADRRLDDGAAHLAVVGAYRPNPWGFHDMHGNLWEFTASRHNERQPDRASVPKNQGNPVARGGSWVSTPEYCRSAFRNQFGSRTDRNFIGFRVALRKSVSSPSP